jgi:tRNA threonylcarbamoyladenosine biosynthesis protein TsaE
MKKFTVKKLKDLSDVADYLGGRIAEVPLCLFYGPMASGKTTLISEICSVLEITGNISSPTFTIVNEYKDPGGKPVYHIDIYRVKDMREAVDAGIEEYLYSGNICMIEWPELIEEMIEPPYISVHIDAAEDGTRTVAIDVVR